MSHGASHKPPRGEGYKDYRYKTYREEPSMGKQLKDWPAGMKFEDIGLPQPYTVTSLRAIDGTYCHLCGARMFVDSAGVSHHGTPSAISHGDDADHMPVAENEITD